MEPAASDQQRIALAAVAGAHGIKGEVKLKLFSDSIASMAAQDVLYLNGKPCRLLAVRDGKIPVARFEGVTDRSAAEALRGQLVEVDRSALPPLGEGEYYHSDLIGLNCETEDGTHIGTVVAVNNYGASDVIEIKKPDGKLFMAPMNPEAVPSWSGDTLVLSEHFLV